MRLLVGSMPHIKSQLSRSHPNVIDPRDAVATTSLGSSSVPTGYYVIIGRGTAATVNHTTLRATTFGRRRISGLPILHIGFEDPWVHFDDHMMGQFPHMLSLPGYIHQPKPKSASTDNAESSAR